MSEDYTKWPYYTRLSPAVAQRYAEVTRKGHYNLHRAEILWRDLHPTLKRRGYQLRPRYEADWAPSWLGTNIDPTFCEDSLTPLVHNVIDATRTDGLVVAIKRVDNSTPEIEILQFLSSSNLRLDPLNHCIPILDIFPDPVLTNISYIVMPLLRPFDDPQFAFIGEVIDFLGQTLQGLRFLHNHGVAHRDCTALNTMMDGTPLYPQGFHPFRQNYSRDAIHELKPLHRIDHPVRYYFIDFGLSSKFQEGEPSLVKGGRGRDQEVPEFAFDAPYDAYKLDVFTLGNLYRKEFVEKYHDLDFLLPLISIMTEHDPARRPSAFSALTLFRRIHAELDPPSIRWRLRSRGESMPERVIRDTVAVAKEGISSLRRLVGVP